LTSVRLQYSSPALVAFELLANLMLSQQNDLSITWRAAVDSGELLLVLGPAPYHTLIVYMLDEYGRVLLDARWVTIMVGWLI